MFINTAVKTHYLLESSLAVAGVQEVLLLSAVFTFLLLPATLAANNIDSGVVSAKVLRLLTMLCLSLR